MDIRKVLGKCSFCGKEDSVRRGRKFCSLKCYWESKRGIPSGAVWSEEARKKASERHTGKGNPAYGKIPYNKGKKAPHMWGDKHPNYKGGWVQDGYKWFCIEGKGVAEHRYVMEKHLGRKLTSLEIVHHINHDRLDNRLENLQIMSRAEHAKEHSPRCLR